MYRRGRIFPLVVAGTILFGPGGVQAAVLAPIVLPVKTVKVVALRCNNSEVAGNFDLPSFLNSFANASPALAGAPTFSSGNHRLTTWGRGWFSENDQTFEINRDQSLTWTDGEGNQFTFFKTAGSTVPAYSVPAGLFVSLEVVAYSSGAPTSVRERDKDGASRLFTVQESTSVLRFSRLTDRNGNTVDYTRDATGRLTRATDIHGRFFELSYDPEGFVSQLTDSGGRTLTNAYDAQGRRTGETGPDGAFAYEYDAENRMTKITYPNGGVTDYAYDAQGRVLTKDDGGTANRLTYAYFASSNTITDALGRVTVQELASIQGVRKVTRIIEPSGASTSFTYDSNLNLLTQTDPLGRVTRYTYDALGNVTVTEDPAGGRTLASYEPAFNQVASLTDPLSKTTLMSYDPKGNLTRIEDPLAGVSVKAYDAFGHVSQSRDPLGEPTDFTYKPANGALASVRDPLSRTTALETDALSNVTRNTDPASKATRYAYDLAGNLTQVTDALGGVTAYAYDPGRSSKLLASVKDAKNQTTGFEYDAQGRLTRVTNALGQSKSSEYDAKGNLTRTVNARGQEITYSYDTRDRLVAKTMPEGVVSYAYDAAGNMTRVQNHNGSVVELAYDALNRVTQSKQTLPGGYQAIIGYGYDANGNRTSMTTPWGNFSYNYDDLNRLTRLTNPQGRVFEFQYDAAGRRTRLTYPNGIETAYEYDAAGQVLSINHHRTADQGVVAFSSYTYDAAGNRTSMTDLSGAHSYGYDDLHRLTSATHPGASFVPTKNETFGYDPVGNRQADANITNYQYDAANRLLENSSFTYTYDADGNQTGKTDKATLEQTVYGFDSESQLKQVDLPDGTVFAAKYDGLGRRIEKSTGTAVSRTARYVYDNEDIVAMLDGDNAMTAVFSHGPGIDEPLMMRKADGAEFFMHQDGLGSIIAHSDNLGFEEERICYGAYGMPILLDVRGPVVSRDDSFTESPYAFTSRERDRILLLYYHGARYRDFTTGGFLSRSPMA